MKKNVGLVAFISMVFVGMAGGAFAQLDSLQPSETGLSGELTETERQTILAEITRQLEEVEQELILLSLAVTKLALEEQALMLQQQIAAAQAAQAEPTSSLSQGASAVPLSDAVSERQKEESQESVFTQIDIQDKEIEEAFTPSVVQGEGEEEEDEDEEKEESTGFLAALGPLGNLGKPELAVLAILAILAAFMVIRRLRGGARKETILQPRPTQHPQVFQSSSVESQNTVDKSREELKQQVVWK